MSNPDLLSATKALARIDLSDEDATLELMIAAAQADVLAAAGYTLAEGASLPSDLAYAICDQAAMLFDARGGTEDRPMGLSLAASRIVSRYRGVRVCLPTSE
ncbi:hypothetical protein GQF56_06075 [Rhodobacter sphaeroides]|jgi:uncharacterized phage protein (possible DNA packaging)|uniref:Uncharacterized phage protein n=1 Tax=Cereibacter sphaeroides (strain ATCC 17023 / DSM 158 / JCM 6121 / CCUG 31486 / LMG 2827 / NBRC 12203 / NCIMB 8253 / ATH 2.4.1.) TaxID=272943 RepID=Q3J1F0_CERS4|nr:head-tail connector protein [Cereibacter sphaeroides]ABA79384.1 putative uncharacterized phage protein [Cereibacter sphaeroides 2.4.1]AMJ47681.1 hypothetical protein APX01_09070 [Cereibacter sphaeroides]ANS34392.1 hypothetical protein A3858_09095 [Cereibacter sphaeroides]ATN63437.1 hypothetical protein A3857_09090 [Cereibacter sphaeroides]AXC61599.1 hypothetical protein DQL45_09545 [Cereibacter sphaeroides 2.4.1]